MCVCLLARTFYKSPLYQACKLYAQAFHIFTNFLSIWSIYFLEKNLYNVPLWMWICWFLLVQWALHIHEFPWYQSTSYWKHLKNPESIRKKKLKMLNTGSSFCNIYIVLGITSKLKITYGICVDVHRLYAKIIPFHKGCGYLWIRVSSRVLQSIPQILREDCTGEIFPLCIWDYTYRAQRCMRCKFLCLSCCSQEHNLL